MCLLVFAHRVRAELPCVLVANRDERYARSSAALQLWVDRPELCAGRDLEQGGTWLGVTRGGRFAALTNFRSGAPQAGARSRGLIVLEFLSAQAAPAEQLAALAADAGSYAGFSLIAGELGGDAYFFSNRGPAAPRKLAPGLYGLSNELLDTPWPKVVQAKRRVAALLAAGTLEPEALGDTLLDRAVPDDRELPDTGIGLEAERRVAPSFIAGEHYGTRANTAVLLGEHGAQLLERSYGPGGRYLSSASASFPLER